MCMYVYKYQTWPNMYSYLCVHIYTAKPLISRFISREGFLPTRRSSPQVPTRVRFAAQPVSKEPRPPWALHRPLKAAGGFRTFWPWSAMAWPIRRTRSPSWSGRSRIGPWTTVSWVSGSSPPCSAAETLSSKLLLMLILLYFFYLFSHLLFCIIYICLVSFCTFVIYLF